jgi:catechol 2,3-dioxygenase-like lactoylglutathione lyase family enzyme
VRRGLAADGRRRGVIRLDHINIHAENLEAARDFLLAVLPLEEGFRPPFDFPGYWLYLDGKPIIHMQTRAAGMGGRGWIDHLAFAPFDFEAERRRLDALGLSYVVGGIPGTGIRQLFVTGPEGLKLELQCPDAAF